MYVSLRGIRKRDFVSLRKLCYPFKSSTWGVRVWLLRCIYSRLWWYGRYHVMCMNGWSWGYFSCVVLNKWMSIITPPDMHADEGGRGEEIRTALSFPSPLSLHRPALRGYKEYCLGTLYTPYIFASLFCGFNSYILFPKSLELHNYICMQHAACTGWFRGQLFV